MYNLGSKILAYLEPIDKMVQGEFPGLITCEIDPSNYCQNNCEWCIYADYIKSNRIHLGDLAFFVKIMHELKEQKCKSITFTGGGEPLCNPNISAMITIAASFGFELGLITNGILLNRIFEQLHLFKFIRISLDAISDADYFDKKGTRFFNKICENIQYITDHKLTQVGLSMIYQPGERGDRAAKLFPGLSDRLGGTYAQIKPLVNQDSEKATEKMNEIKKAFVTERYLATDFLPCQIAGLIGQIGADGNYYYCCIHRGKEKYRIGNLRTESLSEIIKRRFSFVPDLKDCSSCRYMNYAKEYSKVKEPKFQMLRHINFL